MVRSRSRRTPNDAGGSFLLREQCASHMRVIYLTAGAAGMYCGSCMRDNTLAAALRAQGREVLLAPLYTPIRTDEADVSEQHVLYGGINVYLQQSWRLFRHLPRLVDRLLDSAAILRRVPPGGAGPPTAKMGAMTVSMLRGEEGAQSRELRKLIGWLSTYPVDLVNLPNAMFVGAAAAIRRSLNVPVLCTLTGEDLFLDALPEPFRSQSIDLIRRQVRDVDGFVAVTRYYAGHAAETFRIPPEKLHVVPLGVRVDDHEEPTMTPAEPFTIGYLARVCPEKGLHLLCDAFRRLRQAGRICRLRVAGYLNPSNREYLAAHQQGLADGQAAGQFEYLGEVDRIGKLSFLRSLHVLSVPTVYREAKGLYVLEAMAAGLPVVQPNHGAFPEIIQATGGGLLVEPHSPAALAAAIARLMDDHDLRISLGRAGRAAVLASYTDRQMAEQSWSLYEEYVRRHARRTS